MQTTPEMLREVARRHPHHLAIVVDGGNSITFEQLDRRSSAVARGLQNLGLNKGDHVGLLFDTARWDECTVAYFAVHKAGGIVLLLLQPSDLAATRQHRQLLPRDSSGLGVICPPDMAREAARTVRPLTWVASVDDLEMGNSTEVIESAVTPSDTAVIGRTSGTTGAAKLIAASHDNLTFFCRHCWRTPWIDDSESVWFKYLHTNWTGSPVIGDLVCPFRRLSPTAYAHTMIAMRRFDPTRFCALIEELQPTHAYLSPPMALMVLDSRAYERYDVSSVRSLDLSESRTPPAIIPRLESAFPRASVVIVYSTYEIGPMRWAYVHRRGEPYPNSLVGEPVPCVDEHGKIAATPEIQIVDESENEVPIGQVGDIWARCAVMPKRFYYEERDNDRSVFRDDGWINTGDTGYIDHANRLFLYDRRPDHIVRGVRAISSLEIEDLYYEHPAVLEVAALAIPDERLGEEVGLAVSLRDPTSVRDLQRFARERIESHKVPRVIIVLDRLPRSPRGKILKRNLRKLMRSQQRRGNQ